MKRRISHFFSLVTIVAAALLAGCATMTEAERLEREYDRIEWRQQFVAHRDACSARGGRFEFDGSAEQDRHGVPKYKVRYICSLPPMTVATR